MCHAVLQLFLSSPKPVLKFAATRTLAALALTHPASVAACNVDLENLIADPNRSVATYAITTLLKVGLCSSVSPFSAYISPDRQRSFGGSPYEADYRLYVRDQ